MAKDPAQLPGLLANYQNLAMVMMTMVAVMMGRSTRRNNRDSQDHEGNSSKKQRAQLHKSLSGSHSFRVTLS
ncbi:MAG: hypothetical protein ABSA39_11030 [Edaphobacter sp.]